MLKFQTKITSSVLNQLLQTRLNWRKKEKKNQVIKAHILSKLDISRNRYVPLKFHLLRLVKIESKRILKICFSRKTSLSPNNLLILMFLQLNLKEKEEDGDMRGLNLNARGQLKKYLI